MGPAAYVFRSILAHPYIISATLASLLLIAALFPLLHRTPRFLLLVIVNLILTTLALGDMVHVRFYADVLSVSDLVMTSALGGVLRSILKEIRPSDVLYYSDVLVAAATLPFYVSACKHTSCLRRPSRAWISLGLAVFGLAVGAPTVGLLWWNKSNLFSYTTVRIEAASAIGILPYHFIDALVHLTNSGTKLDPSAYQRARRLLAESHRQKRFASALAGVGRRRNVIVISAESLQAFPLGLQFNGQSIMPRLSAFAKESLHFVNFYDQTYLGTTSDAEFMAMQSLHPLPAGALVSQYHHHHFRGLPKLLMEHGYTTLSMCAASADFWHMDQMHRRLGFQKSYFEDSYRGVERINDWLPDADFFSQSVDILKSQREPFMAFLLSSSNHHPYLLPPAHKSLNLHELEGTSLGDYLHSVHYFDRAFGVFIDKLRGAGLLDKSLILVYGDHQGFLGDSPELARLLGVSPGDGFRMVQTRKNLPLLVRFPQGKGAGMRTRPGGHLDIAPTVLSLLGIVDDKSVMLGSDLTAPGDSLVAFRDGSFVAGTRYFMKWSGAVSGGTCYDIETGREIACDPLEPLRSLVLERLEISDLIVRGDLIRHLTDRKLAEHLADDKDPRG
jgi:phosphoglycerol transferase MdoB-like AlkP superfamily enzyme